MTNVAVVVVHGVADQERASSARSIADLLTADPQAGYSSFAEVPLRIARERMMPHGDGAGPIADPGLQYMHAQLEHYRENDDSAGAVYDTVRLEGTRNGAKPADVHVHEVYWADLSRAGATWYRLLAEFYQLILHLPSLGRNALKGAKQADKRMTLAYALQVAAVWVLTVPIPLINVVMLSLGIVALSAKVPEYAQRPVLALGAAGITGAVATLLFTKFLPRRMRWFLTPIVAVAAGAAAAFALPAGPLYPWVAGLATIVSAMICILLAKKYEGMKRGAFIFGIAASIVMVAVAITLLVGANTGAKVYIAAVEAAKTLQPSVEKSWGALFVLATLAAIAGFVLARGTANRRAAWTSRVSLALPAVLFPIFTLAIWLLVTQAVGKMSGDELLAKDMEIALMSSAKGLELSVLALAIFVAAAVWVAGPSIVCEIRNPTDDAKHSESLGRWLSKGLLAVGFVANILTLPLVAMIVVSQMEGDWLGDEKRKLLLSGTAASIVGLLTIKYLSGPFRATLDILLDVDNYMRESPADATPRARIAERFVSMLRHLCQWRDANGNGYSKIVIIAHSQGTVIAADALRYLKHVPDPSIAPIATGAIPLSLFTMGSPLKQLYAFAFPHLYDWVESPASQVFEKAPPTPLEVLARAWANAYRTGDYVGRFLWLDPADNRLWVRATIDDGASPPSRVQICVGPGAHTHYWNAAGGDVGRYLDQMI